MPRPPPPATALTKTGKPTRSAAATRASASSDGSVDSRTGSPARFAAAMAVTLLPAISRTSADGPTKVIPASAHAVASSGFSDRKP